MTAPPMARGAEIGRHLFERVEAEGRLSSRPSAALYDLQGCWTKP